MHRVLIRWKEQERTDPFWLIFEMVGARQENLYFKCPLLNLFLIQNISDPTKKHLQSQPLFCGTL